MAYNLNLPGYYEDPYYKKAQDPLLAAGTSLLEGKPNDYYKDIGESGGAAFQDMMAMLNRDVKTGVTEDMARRGTRGGAGAYAISKAVGDIGTTMRWNDFNRALQGKQFLLGAGLDTLGGVRTGAINMTNSRNSYNLDAAGLGLKADQLNMQEQAYNDQQISDMISSLISGGAGIASLFAGRPAASGLVSKLGFAGDSIGGGGGGLAANIDYDSLMPLPSPWEG